MGVFHVVNMEPFRTWDSGKVSRIVPVNPPRESEEDDTLLGDGGSGMTSSDCPIDNAFAFKVEPFNIRPPPVWPFSISNETWSWAIAPFP
ncbi:hypothetical protein G5714_001248 [Onychostoma macrolepis]|uniref:Uncharacterized protein n=1 Tax=Onychostoma macrolepis TaxID=369639 RepID=A0A7J6DIW8_9TELE|nr:hypothetical protein G5714_001248 [Onychostoma macrolepis]